MTTYVDEDYSLSKNHEDKLIALMDMFHIICVESLIDGKPEYTVHFKPITYKNIEYYITMDSIAAITEILEFKHIKVNHNGFITFVFIPYNHKIWDQVQELSFRNR